MNGAEKIMQTAAAAGIEVCFANPGTTELPLVAAMDKAAGMRPVLGLFEGCCTGAADGYGRLAGKPALTLLHLGPGLANGIANLHNARRARTPLVNLIGEHATWHRSADAPLTMDIEALAGTVSGWQRTVARVENAAKDMAEAIAAARSGMVASLIVPHDIQQTPYPEDFKGDYTGVQPRPAGAPDPGGIEYVARQLYRGTGHTVMILGGEALNEDGLKAAANIRDAVGCDLMVETFPARMERGQGLPAVSRVPYFPDAATGVLGSYETIVLAGARRPVSFFGYPGQSSCLLREDQHVLELAKPSQQADVSLVHLAASILTLGLPLEMPIARTRDGTKTGSAADRGFSDEPLSASAACAVVAALQPENAIIVDEAVTSGGAYFEMAAQASRHTLLTLTGGSLGQGMPCAVGAAVACPRRPVIDLQADGSALYTLQSLWMQAREGLDITTLLFANRSYNILKLEMARAGILFDGRARRRLTDLGNPSIGWVQLSRSMGVPAVDVHTSAELAAEMQTALAEPGPHLIVVNLI